MPASRRLIIVLFLASTLGVAALGWRSVPADSGFRATLLRCCDYGPHRRVITLQITNCGYGTIEFRPVHQKAQSRVGKVWMEPRELHGLDTGNEGAFISPVEADAFRLMLEFRREPLSHRVLLFFQEHGLQKKFPKLCGRVADWFPKSKTAWRHASVDIILPNGSQLSERVKVRLHDESAQATLIFACLSSLIPRPSAPELFRSAIDAQ